jgi:hypothetical protein
VILGNEWIKIYPNPFKGSFNVLFNPSQSGIATLRLYDNAGRLCQEKQINIQSGQPQFLQFETLQPLATGIYTLRYNDGVNKKSIRIFGS